jgi:Tfp pilus assembly protein PilO
MPEQHLKLTVDDLEDRIAMLQDVRAKLSYLKRDLAVLLASLPDLDQPCDRVGCAQ